MEQVPNGAAVQDAQIMLGREEYALSMGQRSNDTALTVAQIMLIREECALGIVEYTVAVATIRFIRACTLTITSFPKSANFRIIVMKRTDDEVSQT